MKKGIVALLAFVMVSMAFCAWSPGAMAQPTDLWIEDSPFTHNDWEFVPDETISIHIEGVEDDVFDILIVYDPWGANSLKREWDDRTIPSSEEIVLNYEIPDSAASIEMYQVQIWDEPRTTQYWWFDYNYWVVLFDADMEIERDNYIAGEKVTAHYMCWYIMDHGPVTDGNIDWVAIEDATNTEIAGDDIPINDADDAVGTFSFNLGTGTAPGWFTVYFWLNDTDSATPDHTIPVTKGFEVETLDVDVDLDKAPPAVYAPEESVRVDVTVLIDGEPVAGAEVDIIVREDGDIVASYGADDLLTKTDGTVTHIFTLDANIADETEFEVEAEVRLEDVTVSDIELFTVEEEAIGDLEVTLKFDKNIYLTGETITATARVQTSGTTTADISYRFWIRNAFPWGDLIYWTIQPENELQWVIPDDFSGGLHFTVDAKNTEGYEDSDSDYVDVVYGHLLVDADKKEYEAGDTITVSFELVTNVMTDPEFFYAVEVAGLAIESGPAGANDFSFDIPAIPADSYRFVVIAIDEGYEVEGADTSRLLAGFFMSFEFDKEAYSPGDTVTITYEIKARGDSTLPGTFNIQYGLMNGPGYSKQTTNAKGTLKYKIPDGIDEGHQLFTVTDGGTAGAMESIYVRSGLNPFEWAKLADTPMLSVILLILVIILFVLVFRRGRAPKPAAAPPAEKPAPEPEPEPAPAEEAATPGMVINCKACGAPIELTTSKRPLEVMCPSCGETEMVQ
ncbi:MAG: hypothetical protein LN416_03940 [Candidatus Thermoplasmatota archaeon]|nr:hypothetical protein [Candidatus Thermoplasmatota archaeon]